MGMIVSEGHWALREEYGKFTEVLEPGIYGYVPYIYTTKSLSSWGNVANKKGFLIEKSEQQTNTPTRHCQTKDNVTININTSIAWRILDPQKAVYAINNLPTTLSDLVLNTLRANIGTLKFDEIFTSHRTINKKICSELEKTTNKWGIELLRVEIQQLTYSKEVEKAMMQLMTADRKKQALITLAEGEAEKKIIEAKAKANVKLICAEVKARVLNLKAEHVLPQNIQAQTKV